MWGQGSPHIAPQGWIHGCLGHMLCRKSVQTRAAPVVCVYWVRLDGRLSHWLATPFFDRRGRYELERIRLVNPDSTFGLHL